MSTKKRIISVLCAFAMLFTAFATIPATVFAASYDTPVASTKSLWEDPVFSTDHAYSFAFVGDTQYLNCGDYYLGTNQMERLYGSIADTAAERKLEHVFVLGDITDLGYKNDANLAGSYYATPLTYEWENAQRSISLLNGVVDYSLVRGNHDDYMMDDYFNQPFYTNQFKNCGGFYSDSNAKWTDIAGVNKSRETDNPEAYVYWSAKTGYHKNSIVNSWKTVEISGTKYLFITVDFNPTDNVLNWVDETLAKYPDHRAIITTHGYLASNGNPIPSEEGSTMYLFGNQANVLWDEVLSQHSNVFMIVSGHVGCDNVFYTYNEGVKGNKVLQVLVDPQNMDAKEIDKKGTIEHGTQDTGMVLYMNFSADGNTITFDYYSTLFGKMKKYNDYTIKVGDNDSTVTSGDFNLSKLEAYGQKNAYITTNSKVAPTLDGTVNASEYTATKTTTAEEAGYAYESDLKEYFAQDDDYIYYAFSIKQSKMLFKADSASEAKPFNYQFNFRPNYAWVDFKDFAEKHYPRLQMRFQMDENGNLTLPTNGNLYTASDAVVNVSAPEWNKDAFISASRKSSVNTFEIKISKDYFKRNNYPEIENLAYALFLGYDSSQDYNSDSSKQLWYRWDGTGDAMNAMKAQGYTGTSVWMFQYMIFEDAVISTLPTASVRLYDETNNGLRFKSEVNLDMLDRYIDMYGDGNVSVGTLIAPTDTLNGKALTHDIGEAGRDYVDVVATINAPFAKNDDIAIYAGSIVNIEKKNLDRDFTAVGYIKLVDENGIESYVYSAESAQRNIDYVSFLAFSDVKNEYVVGYAYQIKDTEDVMYGKYSPYTKKQRDILVAMMVDKTANDPFASDPY